MKTLGLYLHTPFCRQKCAYCDFYSLMHREGDMDDYCAALTRHLRHFAPRAEDYAVDTVYFGGGTPSYLGADRLCRLLDTVGECYHVAPDAEITWEANPDSVGTAAAVARMKAAGFNRISLGVQAMDDKLLQEIGRIHNAAQVVQAVETVRAGGIGNMSLDLIYGLPGQTLSHWQKTLQDTLALSPDHLSCYGLKVEEGTPLWQRRGEADLPDDEAQADMYLWAVEHLAEQGYAQYEISNFARPGKQSRHNLKYWSLDPYVGFGPGAHSDFGGERFGCQRDLPAYLRGEITWSEKAAVTQEERCMEYVMLSLRRAEGLDSAYFEQTYGRPFAPLAKLLVQWEAHGLTQRTAKGYRLTPQGFLVSNGIIVSLQEVL